MDEGTTTLDNSGEACRAADALPDPLQRIGLSARQHIETDEKGEDRKQCSGDEHGTLELSWVFLAHLATLMPGTDVFSDIRCAIGKP
jgi:hypothetical protein